TSIFSHPVYLFLRKFSLQDSRGGSGAINITTPNPLNIKCSSLNIDAPGGVNMNTPLLKVSGDIQDNASSQSSTVKNLRDNYNNHKHSVSGVQSGGSTINSNATDKPT
ncbi:hypothetical protein VXP88_22665, partial [Escherichia coli]